MVPLAKHAIQHWNGEASKPRDASFLSSFLYKKNNHKLAILAPINLKSMPFYTLHASDSGGIKIITCNKMAVSYTTVAMLIVKKMPDFITSYEVSSSICKNNFIPKESLLYNIVKAHRIRHVSNWHAFFSTCITNLISKEFASLKF